MGGGIVISSQFAVISRGRLMSDRRPTEEQLLKLQRAQQAILDYIEGRPASALCPICNAVLDVTPIDVICTYWVICPNRCLVFNASGFDPADMKQKDSD